MAICDRALLAVVDDAVGLMKRSSQLKIQKLHVKIAIFSSKFFIL